MWDHAVQTPNLLHYLSNCTCLWTDYVATCFTRPHHTAPPCPHTTHPAHTPPTPPHTHTPPHLLAPQTSCLCSHLPTLPVPTPLVRCNTFSWRYTPPFRLYLPSSDGFHSTTTRYAATPHVFWLDGVAVAGHGHVRRSSRILNATFKGIPPAGRDAGDKPALLPGYWTGAARTVDLGRVDNALNTAGTHRVSRRATAAASLCTGPPIDSCRFASPTIAPSVYSGHTLPADATARR